MTTRKIWQTLILGSALLGGCDDPPEQDGPSGLGPLMDASTNPGDAAVDGSADGSVPDAGRPPRTGPAYALVNSDWTATAVSILDPKGQLVADNYINSGSSKAGLVTALSGDVELPKASGEPGILVLIDRFKTDVITRIRLSDGSILGQVKTHTPADTQTSTSYTSNPYDYVYIDPQTAWVTRNQPNIGEGAPTIDKGDDLFKINPTTMQRAGERIDLWVLNETATRTDPNTGTSQEVTLHARPSRMVRIANTLVVGITRTAYDFKAVGNGVVALVDLTTRAVTPFAIPGMKNCGSVNAVEGDTDWVVVTCSGDFNATDKRATAGIVMVNVTGSTGRIEHTYRASDDAAAPIAFTGGTVSLGGTLVGASANDYSGKNPDVFAMIDLATSQRTPVVSETPGTGRFGTPAYDAENGILLLPDAAVDANKKPTKGLRRFQRGAGGTFSELELVRAAVDTGMPVRHVYPL